VDLRLPRWHRYDWLELGSAGASDHGVSPLWTPHRAFVYFGDFENLTILLYIRPDTLLGKHAGMVRYPILYLS
jgi:hypothetical protein